ncbi:MAG TPA: histidine kinase [Cyanobacteria bacterium UBA11159]|nr:histidine kinase [Cyanobacteria bacterium UBA11159]HBS70164.1 histidine kinase [Cyanobacteria bacterium UBA11153]
MTQLPTILNRRQLEELFPNPYDSLGPFDSIDDEEIDELIKAENEGKKVRVIGRYAQVNVQQRQDIPPLYIGHTAVDLEDGSGIFIYPGWHPNAIRSQSEIARYENQRVVVVGTVVPKMPKNPSYPNAASLIGPCFLSIDSIEMAR